MTKRAPAFILLAALCLVAAASLAAADAKIDPSLYAGLAWRNVGPLRAGRVSAVTGAVGSPGVFYMGLPLGGVWKTTSAGITWYPIFDGVKDTCSVGSIEAAPSDPNIIYVGMGDMITGGGINEGDGVYKSTDAGLTWQHLGLDDTKQIPSMLVDPRDPNLVLIAAQGNIHTHTEMRGVFRSADGGKTWAKTLYVDNETGAQKIAWAYDRPAVIFATTVRHYQAPGGAARGGAPAAAAAPVPAPPAAAAAGAGAAGARGAGAQAGPTGTAIYKSTDQGLTWKPITGGGLPNLAGRTFIAVAANTDAQRVYLVGTFGFYRSDDGGATWRQMAADDRRIAGSGYICGVYVDPKNPDIVYNLNTSSYRSLDGGATWAAFKGAPGGDDPQVMWIDPTDGRRLFLGVDQGATVSLDGGQTWSPWYNQSTAQLYHISVDTSYPYWIYASQQDSGSIAVRSRGDLGAVGPFDWYPTAGYEFGSPLADPLDPRIVYAGGPGSGLVKIWAANGQWINVSPNIDTTEPWRKVTNQPMAFSPFSPRELLVGFQYVMSTTDGGRHWKKLSPDLGFPKGQSPPPPNAAPPAPAAGAPAGARGGAGAAQGGSIESMSLSTVAQGVIWVGTTNGLIKLTRDHGATWEDVTIPDLPNPTRADVSAIDASPLDAATAYAAVDYHTTGDYAPYLFRTRDYGKTWTKIVGGLAVGQANGSFARVVRADAKRAGLLFAGTESSVYVSFDDGDSWQSLMLNLPCTSYRDLLVKDNDLVAGTYGRGVWILDDISPLRQIAASMSGEPAHLFKPGDAVRVRRNVNGDTPFPPEVPHMPNPPLGAVIYYSLGAKPAGTITLEIADAAGRVVRHFSSAPIPPLPDPPPAVPDYWLEKPQPMPVELGTNRIAWNIRHDNPPAFSHNFAQVMGAMAGDTPAAPEGPLALPGVYTLKLTVDGKASTQTLTVKNDPRSPAGAADLRAQHDLQMRLYAGIRTAWDGYQQVAAARAAVAAIVKSAPPADVAKAATDFDARLAGAGGAAGGGRRGGGPGGFAGAGGAAAPPNFAALNGTLIRQLDTLDYGDLAPNEPMLKAFNAVCAQLTTAVANWKAIVTGDLPAFNAVLAKNGLPPVPAPAADLANPMCGPLPASR